MYYKTALTKNWSNPKDITAKEIAECIYNSADTDMVAINYKMQWVAQSRRDAIGKEIAKLAKEMQYKVLHEELLIGTAKALGVWFEVLGGVLYGQDGMSMDIANIPAGAVVTGGAMPTNIKTIVEAQAVAGAVSIVMSATTVTAVSGTRKHNSTQNAKVADNIFLKYVPTREAHQADAVAKATDHLLSNGFSNKSRAKRVATKLTKIIFKTFKKQ